MMNKTAFCGSLALAAAMSAGPLATPAYSANINIHDLLDTVSVDTADFEFGVTVTHMNIFGGEDDVQIKGSWISLSPDGSGGNIVGLLEPSNPLGISEFIRSSWTVSGFIANITIDFGSDPPLCAEEPKNAGTFCGSGVLDASKLEDGTMQNINDILSLPANLTVQVQSDVAAPEPATLALFGAGLAGLGALRRRRKAKAQA